MTRESLSDLLGTVAISVTAVHDAPIFSPPGGLARPVAEEGGSVTLTLGHFGLSDIDNTTEQLILRIDAQLVVRLGDEVITDCSASLESEAVDRFERCFDEIQALLGQNYRLQQEESLYLLADTTIPYGFVVGAMNRIRLAGVTNVGMVTNPEYLRP